MLSLAELVESQQRINRVEVLPITLGHVLALEDLPSHHKDPFDRLLIAQTRIEEAILITKDPVFTKYPVKVLW
jgi:PIN domain nuclease of toxin-antitoxin system